MARHGSARVIIAMMPLLLTLEPTCVLGAVVVAYCGYIGGSGHDEYGAVAVDAAGNAYVTGYTPSDQASFPVTVGPDLTFNGLGPGLDAFVAKVRADGTGFLYAGYIGGASVVDWGLGVAVDVAGRAHVTGHTKSDETTFPVAVGPDLTYNGSSTAGEAFVARVRADGTGLEYAGYIGGNGDERGYGVTLDPGGGAYVTGFTTSSEATFPAAVGPDLTYNGGLDAFVAKVRADGTGLVFSGYIGGSGDDVGYGIATSAAGNAYLAGDSGSTEATFPVTVGPDLTYNGNTHDAFVVEVSADGTGLVYAGYIGGSDLDHGWGIALDVSGNAYVTGGTASSAATFPATVGPDLTSNGVGDAFVARVRADGAGLVYAGYLGGAADDGGFGIAVDTSGSAHLTGYTQSSEATFPVAGGPDLTFNGVVDAFVAEVRADGSSLVYAGYIGGDAEDVGSGIAVDAGGIAYVAGDTYSTGPTFPIAVGPDVSFGGIEDSFVARIATSSCARGSLIPPVPLLGVKTAGAFGALFAWGQDPSAQEYHLNTVTAKVLLRETDPMSPRRMPVGQGETQCTSMAPTVTCIDTDAIADPRALLFYQVLSACGASGADEGPVCTAAAPCP